jgi:hypothetical protein
VFENLDCVVRNVDRENEALCRDLELKNGQHERLDLLARFLSGDGIGLDDHVADACVSASHPQTHIDQTFTARWRST